MNKQNWISCALDHGFESFEVYQIAEKERQVSWYDGTLESFTTSRVVSTALRGVTEGRMANMSIEETDDAYAAEVIRTMKVNASAITSEDAGILRDPQKTEEAESTRVWVHPEQKTIEDVLKRIEEGISTYDTRMLKNPEVGWEDVVSVRSITSSKGMNVKDQTVLQCVSAEAAASENGEVKNEYAIEVVENLETFDTDAFVKKLCDGVLFKLGAKSVPSGNYPVILEKDAMTSLFTAFAGMFSGDLIDKGISPLKDAIHTQIFSSCVTVEDNPRNTNCVAIANYDDEGCPTFAKTIVKCGVFETALYDTKSAARAGKESTGNGFKGSCTDPVAVSVKNCCILPGKHSLEEMCEIMKDGIVITDFEGLHAGVDFISGDFSLQSSGYLVKDGKKDHAVTLFTTAGNFFELMKNITEVGSDLEWKYGTIACPSIAFKSLAIAGE